MHISHSDRLHHGTWRYSDVSEGHEAGAIEFLTKPIREQDLLMPSAFALDRNRHFAREANQRLRSSCAIRVVDPPRARRHGVVVRADEQTVSNEMGITKHGQVSSRPHHEEDGREIIADLVRMAAASEYITRSESRPKYRSSYSFWRCKRPWSVAPESQLVICLTSIG